MANKDVKLPDIGEGVTEGELVKWLVKPGDSVKADQPVAEVMTDKATVEVPTPYAGVVKELKAKEGDVIPIETTILILDAGGGDAKAAPAKTDAPKAAPAPAANKSAPAQASAPTKSAPAASMAAGATASYSGEVNPPVADSKVLATPSTRRLAREMEVDINQLSGSGIAGRVTREDVLHTKGGTGAVAAGQPMIAKNLPRPAYQGPAGAQEERVPLRGVRKKIAENLQMAKHVIPHFTLMEEVRVTELVKFRTQAKAVGEKYGVKVTYLPFVMKALISTIREFPMFNASIDDQAGEIVYKKYFNLGFAADTPNGLLVPVVKNVDQKTMLEISKEISTLASKARDGKLGLEDMKGATITITNIGSVGGVYATPIINHPEVAILGMYKMDHKPVWDGKQFVPEQVMNFTITCDHRLIDGAVAANFMKSFASRLENPSHLLLDMI